MLTCSTLFSRSGSVSLAMDPPLPSSGMPPRPEARTVRSRSLTSTLDTEGSAG